MPVPLLLLAQVATPSNIIGVIQAIIIVISIILIISGLIAVAWGGFTLGRGMILFLGIAGIGGIVAWRMLSGPRAAPAPAGYAPAPAGYAPAPAGYAPAPAGYAPAPAGYAP